MVDTASRPMKVKKMVVGGARDAVKSLGPEVAEVVAAER